MSVTIIATPGASDANSYATEDEVNAYFAARLPLVPPWEDADDPTAVMAMAARLLDSMSVARRVLRFDGRGGPNKRPYYVTSRAWTGAVATGTQSMAWPRVGMHDRLGRALADDAVPQELKDAQAELAGQLLISDTTLDNAVAVGGITMVKAGSVEIKFKEVIESHVLPDAVMNLLVPSWLTDEVVAAATRPTFAAL